jgi:hypothetical protein
MVDGHKEENKGNCNHRLFILKPTFRQQVNGDYTLHGQEVCKCKSVSISLTNNQVDTVK